VVDRLSLRLVPDQVWLLVEPLIPGFEPRPQGGGTAPLPARAVFTAIVYVPARGCSWRAWFSGHRRLTLRYERKAEHFLTFPTLGASLTCHKKLRKPAGSIP
jgi:transposase